MKKLLFILSFLFVSAVPLLAQGDDDDANEGSDKIRDRMSEFIQKRLDLSKEEADKFSPVFIEYFKEWRKTLRDNKSLPALDRQQKVVDLQLRYRSKFKDILGEDRSNRVFEHQRKFILEMHRLRQEKLRNNNTDRPLRRQGKLI